MGPKLFILYINDICNISKLLNFIIFADDTNIFCTGDNLDETCKLISVELKKLQDWFALNKLSLNVTKTNFMVFGKKYAGRDCRVTINEFKIDRVFVTKFLGVQIDAELTWKSHITDVKNKVYKSLAILKKVKNSLNTDAMVKLYCAVVQSHLNYCVEIWGNCSKVLLSPIIKAQKVAIRLVCNLGYRDHTSSSFKSLNILKFVDLVKFKLQLLMFKAWNVKLPVNVQSLFKVNINNKYPTRKCFNFKVNYCKTKFRSNCVSIIGVKLWNVLEDKFKSCRNLLCFKKCLKLMYLKEY